MGLRRGCLSSVGLTLKINLMSKASIFRVHKQAKKGLRWWERVWVRRGGRGGCGGKEKEEWAGGMVE